MKYQVLGPVAALLDEREVPLQQKCQHLLAVLVMERGQPVPRQRLIDIVWDDLDPMGPEPRLTRIVSELRQHLRTAMPEVPDPVPAMSDAYKLVICPDEADVSRFRDKAAKAKTLDADAAIQMMGAALDEWAEGHGLYGRPLAGIPGSWADSNREKLRKEHRDAQLFRLERIARSGGHEHVAAECHLLDDNADALVDEWFVAMWMTTAYRTGGPDTPLSVFRRAEQRYKRSLGRPVSPLLAELARRIADHDPELGGPQDIALTRLRLSPPASAHLITSDTGQTKETTSMSEQHDHPVFHNENSTIGAQGKVFEKEVTVNIGGAPQRTAPEQTEQTTEQPREDTDGQAS